MNFSKHTIPLFLPVLLLAGSFGSSGSCGEAQAKLRNPVSEMHASHTTETKTQHAEKKPKNSSSKPLLPLIPPDPDAPPSIEDPSGSALHYFFEGLKLAESNDPGGRVAIIQFGDSHTVADLKTSQLRRQLQERFGDAGRGFMLPGRPFRGYYQRDASFGSEGKWEIQNGLKSSAKAPFGLAGVRTYSDSAKSKAWVGTCQDCEVGNKVSRFEVFYEKSAKGGSLNIWLDEELHQELNTQTLLQEPEPLLGGYLEIPVSEGEHQLMLQPVGSGTVNLFGVVMERDTPGVILDAIGLNGAQAMHLLQWDWPLIGEQIARRDPRLIMLAYGTNESANNAFDPYQHQEDMESLIARVKSAMPEASILVVGPPDRNVRERKDCDKVSRKRRGRRRTVTPRLTKDGKIPAGCEWKTPPVIPAIVEAQRRAAFSQQVAFFDTYRAMGGSGTMDLWTKQDPPLAQRDHTHLSRTGYRVNADILFDTMVEAYGQYLLLVSPRGNRGLGENNLPAEPKRSNTPSTHPLK